MAKTEEVKSSIIWKKFLQRHWKTSLWMAGGIVVAIAEAIFVFLWVAATAQATGAVPASLGLWTIGYALTFCLHVVSWELILVVSWVIVVSVIVYYQWYKKLSEEERKEYEREPTEKARKREFAEGGGSDFIGFLIGVTWLIITWLDGRWDLAFQAWTFNDWIYTWLLAVTGVVVVIGVPIAVGAIWWMRKELTTES